MSLRFIHMTGLSINYQPSSHSRFDYRANWVNPCNTEGPFCRGTTTILACMGLTTLICRRPLQE